MSSLSIAIVGMACIYPDARTPGELWENVLAQRRAFRRVPADRLRLEDYFSADHNMPDTTYATEAAVIEGYEFDRAAFRVVGSTFRAADLVHWLALDVASRALADAGFADGNGLPREATGVLLGNTLTGEFSRANALRLRWPFVRRTVETALIKERWQPGRRGKFLADLEEKYKAPFPPVGEETLAGGLSNTIAGRICNQFDLKGGGYTVDGACASSLLAVANSCSSLAAGDLEIAIAGGIDLSLDPFEIVGFAKTGALAVDEMRVFDRRSAGFWLGEGCGMVVLMRHEDAVSQGRRIYAVVRGWGISSDGGGGITRPEADGQLEALRRAYRRAGFGINTVSYCEGHGTGTAVGDAIELEALSRARRETKAGAPPAAIGSGKANIGHTKAAAGIAGMIKAVMAVHTQVLPPTTGCEEPHPHLCGPSPALRILREPESWPRDHPLRASVSAMGFGGINAHVVVESLNAERRSRLSSRERTLSRTPQDAELFLFTAETPEDLSRAFDKLQAFAALVSSAELIDLAAQLEKSAGPGTIRAAVIAATPSELSERMAILKSWLRDGSGSRLDTARGVFLGSDRKNPRIAFLFPGQGSPVYLDGGIWNRRFETVRQLYGVANLFDTGGAISTRVAQPAVVAASLAGLRVLETFGVTAAAGIGHSLGEFTALQWAGVLDVPAVLRIAQVRGAAMAELDCPTGGMLAIAAPWRVVQELFGDEPLAVVGFNSPRQTVVAGEIEAVGRLAHRAAERNFRTHSLPVSHAFHTPLVGAAAVALADQLAREFFSDLKRPVISTVTGAPLDSHENLRELLCRQVTSPVRFSQAFDALPGGVDLLIEVGPGSVLAELARDMTDVPAVALDAGGNSLKGLLRALGAAFALGTPLRHEALFADRFTRPFTLDWKPKFFRNPCELAPITNNFSVDIPAEEKSIGRNRKVNGVPGAVLPDTQSVSPNSPAERPIELIRRLIAEQTELPVTAIHDDHRMLSNLHLNSISVGQLVSGAASKLGLSRMVGLMDFANSSVAEIARALEELKHTGAASRKEDRQPWPPGVDSWVRTFAVELAETKVPHGADAIANPHMGGNWQVFAARNYRLAASCRKALREAGSGVLVWLPKNPGEGQIAQLLAGGKAALTMTRQPRFVVVQHGWGGGGFARTLHLERPDITVCVVNVPAAHPRALEWICREAVSAKGFVEVHYTNDGRRFEPRLKLAKLSATKAGTAGMGPDDVLLVTGGAKGIAAECSLSLARETGVKLALVGRSDPRKDRELADNLARIAATGVQARYLRADVTAAEGVRAAVAEFEKTLGKITGILHGAGMNTPQLISGLDEAAFRKTMAPKIAGMQNLLAVVDERKLRLLIAFSSIIARTGLPGEADYATANEWLSASIHEFQDVHPRCRCLALEWSVWSGVGMGERLGRVELLAEHGITPITVDGGVRMFTELLRLEWPSPSLVVSGRFGEPRTLRQAGTELPLRRFLERKRVFYPGVELVVDAELSLQTDPFLADHVTQGKPLFPAVFGLEAMAQTAMAVIDSEETPVFEDVEFLRPVAVPDKSPLTIRLAALRRESGAVEVCLRSEETDFQVDHFRAVCRFDRRDETLVSRIPQSSLKSGHLTLDPQKDLYGRILFHDGRFRRLCRYLLLNSKECAAEITPDDDTKWFGPYLPMEFTLGDPAARDAALHAIQSCIPHRRILPTGFDRLIIRRKETGRRFVRAKERSHDENEFKYDVEMTDACGELVERWEGLRLRAVELMAWHGPWPDALLTPYFERRLEEFAPDSPQRVALEHGPHEELPVSSDAMIQHAVGKAARVWRRPDGKPVLEGEGNVSAAHTCGYTLAIAGTKAATCDLEEVVARAGAVWRDLLGDERFKLAERMAHESGENVDAAATRLWAAMECLKKAGLPVTSPLVLDSSFADGWTLLRSGSLCIPTCVLAVQGMNSPLGVAMAVQSPARSKRAAAVAKTA